jgi:hypothetical protein
MRVHSMGITLVTCISLAGCMSSARVYRSNSLNAPPHGIPFYSKTAICKQETIWLEPQYTLTFSMKSGAQAYGPIQKVLSRKEYLQPFVQDFVLHPRQDVWEKSILPLPVPTLFNEGNGEAERQIICLEHSGNWARISNTGTLEAVVDYSNVFYLNSARPLAGQTQVDAKLASDGTLTEGSAQLQDQTLATIASSISSLVGDATNVMKIVGLEASPEFRVSISTKIYKHSHVRYVGDAGKPATAGSCLADPNGVFGPSYTVTEATDASGGKPAGADKDNTISISGSIVLPKQAAPLATSAPGPTTPPTQKKQP